MTRLSPELKLGYLLVVVLTLVALPYPTTTIVLLLLQTCLWMGFSLDWRPLARIVKRLAVFFLIIALSYAFFSVGDNQADRWVDLPVGSWTIAINLAGLSVALMM